MKLSILIILVFLSSCRVDPQRAKNSDQIVHSMATSLSQRNSAVAQVEAHTAKQWLSEKKAILIDIRSSFERSVSIIEGSIDLNQFKSKDKDVINNKKIIVYDTLGLRATDFINSNSLQAYNLFGGILGWIHAGLSIVGKDGHQTWQVHVEAEPWNFVPEGYEGVL